MHYHINQRLNDSQPISVFTDTHLRCALATMEDLLHALPLLGYQLDRDVSRIDYAEPELMSEEEMTMQFTLETDDIAASGTRVSFTLWGCSCSTGEAEARAKYIGFN